MHSLETIKKLNTPDEVPVPELTEVVSSNIGAIAYDEDELTLWVRFKNGSTYLYAGISAELGIGIFEAESVGSFFNTKIRAQFTGTKLGAEVEVDEEEGESF